MNKITVEADKIKEAMALLNHPSLDDSDEVNMAYNILEDAIESQQSPTTEIGVSVNIDAYQAIETLRVLQFELHKTIEKVDNLKTRFA